MEYRRLGKSGLQVSALSLGSWLTFGNQIPDDVADELMSIAYEKGINFFDNAEGYAGGKSEEVMGRILKSKGWDRESYIVSSKVFFGAEAKGPNRTGLSRKHVIEACNAALRRFQLDYLDLYFCHRPDINTPIEETVWAMNTLLQQGKILYWGTSEWTAAEIMEAIRVARDYHLIGPTMEQPQYNMLERTKIEKDYLLLFREHGLGTTVWSPLHSGVLSGKYNDSDPGDTRLHMEGLDWLKNRTLAQEKLEAARKVKEIADELGVSMPRLAVAWCLRNPNVSTVILGASKPYQLLENLTALDVVPLLTEDIMNRLDGVLKNKPFIPTYQP
ncbi:potassium channel beta subunit family protein [Arcticibacter sp. MXS-1]|uniref:potassium channel beta subunit family protein n=1 Tax=Arcticibacter sp. MXS-1 TaxID=3341726 RepID=UPI0035A81D73